MRGIVCSLSEMMSTMLAEHGAGSDRGIDGRVGGTNRDGAIRRTTLMMMMMMMMTAETILSMI
jgi:hypothetical protein